MQERLCLIGTVTFLKQQPYLTSTSMQLFVYMNLIHQSVKDFIR